eukprot:2572723-Prymnesium_polylepis.1
MATRRWPTRASASTQLRFRPQRQKSWRPRLRQHAEIIFLRGLLREMGVAMDEPTVLYVDRAPRR